MEAGGALSGDPSILGCCFLCRAPPEEEEPLEYPPPSSFFTALLPFEPCRLPPLLLLGTAGEMFEGSAPPVDALLNNFCFLFACSCCWRCARRAVLCEEEEEEKEEEEETGAE